MFWAPARAWKYGGADMKKYLNGSYVEMTSQDLAEYKEQPIDYQARISELKSELAETDYKCLKFVDGALSEDEYAPVREYRQTLRDKINAMQTFLDLQDGE